MIEIYKLLLQYKITPNQYYMMISHKEGLSAPGINEPQTYRELKEKAIIDENNKLCPEALAIIEEVEAMVKLTKKKVTKAVLGPEASDNIDKYREMWNMGKLPSGVPARVNKKELEAKFQKFFQKYEYTWEDILHATAHYIDEFEKANFKYMKNSSYFISKMMQDKSQESTLANYIELLKSGDYIQPHNFQDKVV